MSHAAPNRSVERQRLADAEAELADARSILAAVAELHGPFDIYDPCDHEHTQADIDAGEAVETPWFVSCREALLYTICSHCCRDAEGMQTEACADSHPHAPGEPTCPTMAILDGAA